MKKLFLLPLALAVLLLGCKASLDTSGVYSQPPAAGSLPGAGGGIWLFTIDKTLVDSKDALHSFVSWEDQHHAQVLLTIPAIADAANSVRSNAPTWFAVASQARSTYVSVSSLVNSNALASQVSLISASAVSMSALTNSVK